MSGNAQKWQGSGITEATTWSNGDYLTPVRLAHEKPRPPPHL
jgi:hypothetical protein